MGRLKPGFIEEKRLILDRIMNLGSPTKSIPTTPTKYGKMVTDHELTPKPEQPTTEKEKEENKDTAITNKSSRSENPPKYTSTSTNPIKTQSHPATPARASSLQQTTPQTKPKQELQDSPQHPYYYQLYEQQRKHERELQEVLTKMKQYPAPPQPPSHTSTSSPRRGNSATTTAPSIHVNPSNPPMIVKSNSYRELRTVAENSPEAPTMNASTSMPPRYRRHPSREKVITMATLEEPRAQKRNNNNEEKEGIPLEAQRTNSSESTGRKSKRVSFLEPSMDAERRR